MDNLSVRGHIIGIRRGKLFCSFLTNSLRLPTVRSAMGQELHCDQEGGYEENYGAKNPHEGSGGSLIGERAEAKHSRLRSIAWISNASREDERGGYGGVNHISAEQIREQNPTRGAQAAGPGFDDRPPEQHAGKEETGVFEIVDVLVGQRGFICCRNVPSDVGEVHEQPCGFWLDKSIEKFAQPAKAN